MDIEKIRNALFAARSLMIVDALAPAQHDFEIEKRDEARLKIEALIDEALKELPPQPGSGRAAIAKATGKPSP